MSILGLVNTIAEFVVLCFDGEGVPVSYSLGDEGVACVTSDAHSGDLIYTIGQSPECDGDSKEWLLRSGRYQVYGVSESVMAASTELVTPH
jgi:hypothetical protein